LQVVARALQNGGSMSDESATADRDSQTARPKALSIIGEQIPEELKRLPQWVTWKYELRNNKWTKPPYQVNGVDRASSTDAATWGEFKEAVKTYQNGRADGIGFVLSADDDFVGIDLDHVVNPETHKGKKWAVDIIQLLNSYSELSPSGQGIHILVKGSLP